MGGEGRIYALPWYRLVGVVSNLRASATNEWSRLLILTYFVKVDGLPLI